MSSQKYMGKKIWKRVSNLIMVSNVHGCCADFKNTDNKVCVTFMQLAQTPHGPYNDMELGTHNTFMFSDYLRPF